MDFPVTLKYTKDHEWVRLEGQDAFVGITEFAQGELGDIVYIDITTVGQEVEAGKIFGSVEAVKTVSDLFMPITGTVVAVNPDLNAHPELVNADPYGKGWMAKLSLRDVSDLDSLLTSDQYKQEIGV